MHVPMMRYISDFFKKAPTEYQKQPDANLNNFFFK